jgi:hypothetical protein
MKYVNYEKTTGKILGYYDDTIHQNIPKPNIQITDEQWQNAINNNYNYIDVTTETFSKKDFRTLDELKQDKKTQIESDYQNVIQQPILYTVSGNQYTFQSDQHSQDILIKVIVGAPSNFTTNWLDINNTPVSMTLDDLKGLAQELLDRGQKAFQKKFQLKQQVIQATNKSDLDKIVWDLP